MDNRLEYQTVVLSALLHDIGKFLQRGRSLPMDIQGRHPEVSSHFVSAFSQTFSKVADVELLRTLVLRHHRSKGFGDISAEGIADPRQRLLACLVNKADGLSASERGEHAMESQPFKITPLASVFPRVFASEAKAALFNHHPSALASPKELSKDLFPEQFKTYAEGELEKALRAFGDRAAPLMRALGADYDALVSHLLALLAAHAWPIPADTQEEMPDISLYDHLRTTAAIAACLYRSFEARDAWDEGGSKAGGQLFSLVVGDVSGIQDYIFNIAAGVGVGGVAKRLRARSLYVHLISEAVPWLILRDFDLPATNTLMASGGKFYILLPNLPETEVKLVALQERTDRWFLEELNGCLALNLAWVPFGEDGFKGFGNVLKAAMNRLAERKEQRFRRYLTSSTGWNAGLFLRPPFGTGMVACPSCDRFPATAGSVCPHCDQDREWGSSLKKAEYVLLFGDPVQGQRTVASVGASLHLRPDLAGLAHAPSLALRVNEPDTSPASGYPASFRYLLTRLPLDEDAEVMDFQQVATKSSGRHYLGFLKMDVDSLGQVFAFGLGKEDTISRLATLSRQLDLFFTGWVQHLLETDYSHCYPVFSGGDDLFLVGPWNVIVELAGRLRNDFEKWTCHNPRLTFSAGIAIGPDSYPIGQAAKDTEDALEESKRNKDAKGQEKNSLTLLGHTLTWEQWRSIEAQWQKLRTENVTGAFLYSLLEYGEMWRDYRKNGNVLGLRFQPLLAYNVSRNVDAKKTPGLYQWAQGLVDYRPGDKAKELALDNLGLLAQLLILAKEARHEHLSSTTTG